MDRFFGGNPLVVILKLAIISLIVGVVLAALNLDALRILDGVRLFAVRIYEMGYDAIGWAWNYFLLGAVIVFPIWFISRLMRSMGGRTGDPRS
ncbi:MAG: DUF6460 domain-containing protein [Hyphomicrobiaceae bacterium]